MNTKEPNTNEEIITIPDDNEAAFARTSKIARSPTTATLTGAPPATHTVAPPATPTGAPLATPTGAPASTRAEKGHHRPEFLAMGAAIAELEKDMLDESRRSLTQAMKNAFRKLRNCYRILAKEPSAKNVANLKDDATQTTPAPSYAGAAKRRFSDEKPLPLPKRPRDVAILLGPAEQKTPRSTGTPRPRRPLERKENEWQKVTKKVAKTKTSKKTEKRPRPDAIIIKAKEGTSYADILRKVKADDSLKSVGEAVARVRRTAGGDLLLQLKKTSGQTANLCSSISDSLGVEIEVRALSHKTLIEIKHVDEVTTGEDVLQTIRALPDMEGIPLEAVVNMRKAFGSTQVATLSLSAELAKRLLLLEKIRIGWTVCPIREKTMLTKCFKCLEYGHIAKLCRGEDRSKLCRRCGKADHIAKDCKNEPSCMFCIKNNAKETKYIAGSGRCPTLKKALDNKK